MSEAGECRVGSKGGETSEPAVAELGPAEAGDWTMKVFSDGPCGVCGWDQQISRITAFTYLTVGEF